MKRMCPVFALVLAVCLLLTACTSEKPPLSPVTANLLPIPQGEAGEKETDELIILTPDIDMERIIEQFQSKFPEIKVTAIDPSQEFGTCSLPKTLTDGTGDYPYPDLIQYVISADGMYDWDQTGEEYFADFNQLINAGVLLDLNLYMERDREFDRSLYHEGFLSGGWYRGGQYLLPVGVSGIHTLLGSQEMLDEVGFDDSCFGNALSLLNELARIHTEQNLQNVLTFGLGSKKEYVFNACNPQMIDWETGQILPEEEQFEEFCTAWKTLFYNENGEAAEWRDDGKEMESVRDRKALFAVENPLLVQTFSALKASETPIWRAFPNVNGGVTGEVSKAFGITAKGKNQQNAWKFMKFLLSEAVQGDPSVMGIPVLKSVRDSVLEAYYLRSGKWANMFYGYGEELSEEDQRQMTAVVESVNACQYSSLRVYQLFEESMAPYFQGKESCRDCARDLQAALQEYMEA